MYIRMYLRVYQSELYETRMMEEDEYQKQGKRTRERWGEEERISSRIEVFAIEFRGIPSEKDIAPLLHVSHRFALLLRAC